MQRSRESEKLKPRKKDIKTNDINISVNIGNEQNEEPITESFNNAPQIVKEKVKVSKENNKNLESLILNLKTLIKTFSDKKKQVLNMKIDIPNNIFDLPDISIDSEEDITRFISIITEKIGELNILLQTKKSIPVDIPRETVYSRGSMPIQNYGYSNAFPFGGGQRLPPAFQRPVSYEDYINANRKPPPPAVTNPAVKPDSPTVPLEPPPIDPPPYEPPITPDEPPQVTPVIDPVTPDDPPPVTPVIDPDSDYEEEDDSAQANYAVPLNTRLMELEGYKSKFYKTFSGNNGSPRGDFGYTNLVQAFDRVYNIVKQASDKNAQEGGLSEEEFNYTMDQFFAMDNSNGDFPSAKAYSMITARPLIKSDKIGLVIPREVEEQKDGMMKIYRLVKNGQMLSYQVNGDYGGKFFNKNGDRYNIEDSNTPMDRIGVGIPPPVSGEEEFPDDGRTTPNFGHWYDGFFGTGPNSEYQDGL